MKWLSTCIRFRGRINIPQEIGVKYGDFGLLQLDDHNGARIHALALKHLNDANEINIEIIEEWVVGKGKHPVNSPCMLLEGGFVQHHGREGERRMLSANHSESA